MSEAIRGYREDKDAFGRMLMAYLEGEEPYEIIEREDGHIDASGHVSYYFTEYQNWPAQEQEGMKHLVPGPALDLGCGAGRVELHLQSQGCPVVGIDNSPLAIEVCRRRGVQDARLLPVEKISPDLGRFANIIMYGNNWGLMANPRQARRLLRVFHRMTTPDARILAETNDIYKTDNSLHLNYQAWNRERGRLSGQIRLRVRYAVYQSAWFDYLMVSKAELADILAGTGWRVKTFIDSDGSIYMAIIEKEAS
jgi:SAM-dependent methyltransferase